MQMAAISRWSLVFFGCALLALTSAFGLMAVGFGFPGDDLAAPRTLILIHLVAIGWLSLLMLGALFQFLPVLVGRDLAMARLAPVVLGLLVAGLILLLCGFATLDGWAGGSADLLPLGGLLLLAGFVLAAAILFSTLLRASMLPFSAGFVALALMSLLVTALLGETLASVLAGLIGGDFSVAMISHGLPLHASFGLGGWLTLAAMGVSYRLVSMFLISPERRGAMPRIVLWNGALALGALIGTLVVLIAANSSWSLGLALTGLATVAGISTYLVDMAILYRTRRRAALELHMMAALAAFGMLGLGAILLGWALWTGREATLAAAIHVLALGWLGGLGLAMLYKIIPFLTWLECFAPHMGRMTTPRVQDLVREGRARTWFILYFAAELLSAAALHLEWNMTFRTAAAMQLLAVALLIHHYHRARRLADLPDAWRDHPRPRLLLPAHRRRSLA